VVSASSALAQGNEAVPPGPASETPEPFLGDDPPFAAPDKPYWRTNLFGRFFRDQKYLFTTWWPSEFERPGFTGPLLVGAFLAGSSSSSEHGGADLRSVKYAKRHTTGRVNESAKALSTLGNAAAGAVLIGTGYLIGRWSHHDQLAEASSLSAEALLTAGLYSTALKKLTARTRPVAGGEGDFFTYSPQEGQVASSFPSGHATGAFAVATVFAEVYKEERWVPWVAYGMAGCIGVARVGQGRHFPSDVLVGALLGNSIGRMAVRRQDDSVTSTSVQPYFDPLAQEAGITWSRQW
jgi:membrane-associated phospholipid phosphatase